jgi:hypothetical protein
VLTDAEKRSWTQMLDGITATIQEWRADRQQIEQLILARQYRPAGSVMDVINVFKYPFALCDMDRLKMECYETIDAMIAMKERELKEKTAEFNRLLAN